MTRLWRQVGALEDEAPAGCLLRGAVLKYNRPSAATAVSAVQCSEDWCACVPANHTHWRDTAQHAPTPHTGRTCAERKPTPWIPTGPHLLLIALQGLRVRVPASLASGVRGAAWPVPDARSGARPRGHRRDRAAGGVAGLLLIAAPNPPESPLEAENACGREQATAAGRREGRRDSRESQTGASTNMSTVQP